MARIMYRSLYVQATFNYERMMGLGYCFCLLPFIERFFERVSLQAQYLARNLGFFNTNPYMAGWLIGAVMRLEEESHRTGVPSELKIAKFKKHMSQSLAAIGDQVFWRQLKPICAMLGLVATAYFSTVGLVVFLVAYNVPHLTMRFYGVVGGYHQGFGLVKELSMSHFKDVIAYLDKFAAFLVGALFVLFGFSQSQPDLGQIGPFVLSAGLMIGLLKLRLTVPTALLILILIGVTLIGLLHLV